VPSALRAETPRRRVALLIGAVVLGSIAGRGTGSLPAADLARPARIVLITIDTLRADRLECYGYARGSSPNLSRLAREGVLFRNAVTAVPLTLPAHCSLFTGAYPVAHGVRDQSGFALQPRTETLASRLKALGYATGAFVGAFVLDSRFGLGQGFDFYYDRFDSTRSKAGEPEALERRAEVVAREAERWMEERSGGRFFAWLHFYDPHAPYAPPEPFRSRHAADPYAGEIAYCDSVTGSLLDFLRKRGWYDDSLVIVVADHGEDLGDHGENTHGLFLYDATLRVPLLVKLPQGRYAGKTVVEQVRTIDIMPSVLELAGAAASPAAAGRSVVPLIAGAPARAPDEAYAESFYPYFHFGWSPLRALRTGKYKYVDAPAPELYDLEADPGESKNIAAANRALAWRLRDRLHAAYKLPARPGAAKREAVDASTAERLKSLGYVTASSRGARPPVDAKLPNPKEKLQVYVLLQQALLDSQNGRPQRAIEGLRSVLEVDPGMVDARIHLGLLYKRAGDYASAVEQFKLAIQRDESNVTATYNLAHTYASWGRLSDAIVGFERTLRLDPKEVRARVGLGIAYQTEGSLDKAIREYEAALRIDPFDSTARNNLAAVYLARRDAAHALEHLRRSLEINSRSAETHNLLGSAHWLNGQLEAARGEFREAIALDPKYVDPHLNLAMIAGNEGRTQEALSHLETAAQLAPRSARVLEMLARAYDSAGMKVEAERALSRARDLSKPRP
jgi:arylsulfatase A-like enzyme/Flp pilus assembly protein TadD